MPQKSSDTLYKTALAAVLVIFAIVLFIFAYSSVVNARFNCNQINALKKGTLTQIKISDHRLRTPKLIPAYYKQHPEELKLALKIDRELIKVYQPGKCSGFFGSR